MASQRSKPDVPGVSIVPAKDSSGIVSGEANIGISLEGYERMTRRRFQNPTPFQEGKFWWMFVWTDDFSGSQPRRRRQRVKLAPIECPKREALKIADEILHPINQGLQTIGSATLFGVYVDDTYRPTVLASLASTTQPSYEGIINKYLNPVFEKVPLREMSVLTLQKYFSAMAVSKLGADTVQKIKIVLSSIFASAVRFGLVTQNPVPAIQIPRSKVVNRRKQKPHITPEEFALLLQILPEPYATMVYVAVYTGLRISELIGLKWGDVHTDSLTIDERYCRGDWSITKTEGSNATIVVDPSVTARIHRLKTLEIEVRCGGHGAKKTIKLVRADGPQDLVFQSLRKGAPMSDGNILRRHLRPAALDLKMDPKKVTWRSLRTSCATWMVEAGANPKDVQGQLRHSRIGTTMEIYAQFVPESQRRAVALTSQMVAERVAKLQEAQSLTIN